MCPLSATESGDLSGFFGNLIDHLRGNAVRTDGPYTLRSGQVSSWYIDARQTTFDGGGARLVGAAVLERLANEVTAVGGMTMGADPIAVATAVVAAETGRPLRAFSVRKEAKDHGVGGRLVGPVVEGDVVVALDDTVTTGTALIESIDVMIEGGLRVAQAICLVDRSGGQAERRCSELGVPFVALVLPADLGVEGP
ncbi:MAG: orotate phosphoribosyltransferase [Acidimicrobiia bacterium]|nr:orotate phosphoribosyltransferase [Acidimicrobiia bacterium]